MWVFKRAIARVSHSRTQPPEDDGPIDVAFSAYLWRCVVWDQVQFNTNPHCSVIDVNEVQYQFTAQLRYTLTWRDRSASESIANATATQRAAGEACRRPCTNYNFPSGNPSVQLPQLDTSVQWCVGCCHCLQDMELVTYLEYPFVYPSLLQQLRRPVASNADDR